MAKTRNTQQRHYEQFEIRGDEYNVFRNLRSKNKNKNTPQPSSIEPEGREILSLEIDFIVTGLIVTIIRFCIRLHCFHQYCIPRYNSPGATFV